MAKVTQELKYKRLKVGHACYVCRSKKIKCDGLRPCMQCKARGRNCISSEADTNEKNNNNHIKYANEHKEVDGNLQQPSNDDDAILFSRTKSSLKKIRPNPGTTSSFTLQRYQADQLNTLSSFGKFVRWREEPPLPMKYSSPIEMPSLEIQMKLINEYFDKLYSMIPIIPKRLFFKHLHTKGPLITPLLLNSIYCIVSNNTGLKDIPKASVFFNRARKLLDDFLDTPRVSTVAALCIMSLYQPTPSKSRSANPIDHHCRSWIYNGMASRMCIELGLNVDTTYTHANISNEDIELRRRAFWFCYCYDKIISAEWERVWSISASLSKAALPNVLPEDNEQERLAVHVMQEKIKLIIIGEQGLQIKASYVLQDDISDQDHCDRVEKYMGRIHQWKDNLDNEDTWQFFSFNQNDAAKNKSPAISQVLCIFYFMLCDALLCLPDHPERQQKSRIYASKLIQCAESMVNTPYIIIRCEFLAHCIATAVRILSRSLNNSDAEVAQQSYNHFNKCVKLLHRLQAFAAIPECAAVLKSIYENQQHISKENSISPTGSPNVASDATIMYVDQNPLLTQVIAPSNYGSSIMTGSQSSGTQAPSSYQSNIVTTSQSSEAQAPLPHQSTQPDFWQQSMNSTRVLPPYYQQREAATEYQEAPCRTWQTTVTQPPWQNQGYQLQHTPPLFTSSSSAQQPLTMPPYSMSSSVQSNNYLNRQAWDFSSMYYHDMSSGQQPANHHQPY